MQPAQRAPVSEDEYLDLERRAETKSELIHGEMVSMAATSPRHNALVVNLGAAIRHRTRDHRPPCFTFASQQRVHIEGTGLYTYPDVTVACGPRFHPRHRDTLVNPTVLVEVLSKSTEAYDRGAKFAHYQAIPSFVEYVLVSQRERRVEHFRRLETGQWLLTVLQSDEAVLELPALGCAIPLAEIYDQTDSLDPDDPDDASP